MRILYIILVLSFCALAWAAFAVARHVRRGAAQPPVPNQKPVAEKATPNHRRQPHPGNTQRYDRAYASPDAGNLNDPGEPPPVKGTSDANRS